MVTNKKVAIWAMSFCGFTFCGLIVFALWMRGGEEEVLDYSLMGIEVGPVDPELNGFTYFREFTSTHTSEFPDDFWWEIDYTKRENWDRELFQTILEANQAFLVGVEQAFDRPLFVNDQPITLWTIIPSVGELRSYVNLRVLEIRVMQLDGFGEEAFERLIDLRSELERFGQSNPSGLIGLLTSFALIGIMEENLAELMAEAELSQEHWLEASQNYTLYQEYPEALRQAFRGEFQFSRECIDQIMQSSGVTSDFALIAEPTYVQRLFTLVAVKWGLKPNRTNNMLFLGHREVIEAVELPVRDRELAYGTALNERLMNKSLSRFANRNPYGEVILTILSPAVNQVLEVAAMRDSSSRAMQIRLALHAYYMEHGELPNRLGVLVPSYIPEIPFDPFDGQPMRYSQERRVVYSVGNDFVDNGGSELPFRFTVSDDDDSGECAELDRAEPTYPLRMR